MSQGFSHLTDKRLRELAGSAADRGAAYFQQGRVELLSCDAQRTLAVVHGSEAYRVKLQCHPSGPVGTCDCPAFERTDFCKHMVAVALAAREQIGKGEGGVDRFKAAADFLRGQGLEAAIARLLKAAESDNALLAQIEQDAADLGEDDDGLAARYRRLIDEVTAIDGYIDYWGAGAYAEEIGVILDRLEALIAQGRAGIAVDLCVHFLEAMDEVFEAVDDSEGEIGAVVARGGEIHLAACQAAKPDSVALAQWLFERELGSDWYVYENMSEAYGDLLGAAGAAELRRLAHEAWTARSKADRAGDHTLKALLDRFAREDGDLDARIALRQADLSRPHAFLEIAQLCVEAGRDDQALTWLREGVWMFEDRPDTRLVLMAASLETKAGRPEAATDLLWAAFKRQPNLELLATLKRLEPRSGPVIERAIAILEAKGSAQQLFDLQVSEGLIGAAWETADRYPMDERRLESLADLSRDTHRAHATQTYERLIEGRLRLGGPSHYDHAVVLIRRRGLACGDPVAHAAYLEAIRLRHKAKRSFIARLDPLF